MDIIDIAKKVIKTESDAVAGLAGRINDSFVQAIDLIYRSPGRVVVTGMGKSGLIGKKIAATLASTGTPSFFLHPAEASHGDLGMVTADDVVIALSNSGETDEIVDLIPFLKRFNVNLISLTGNPESVLAKASDVTIDISVREEACPFGFVPTASTAATLAMGDAIAIALLVKRGFKEEDFAAFHPRGIIGKKLLITVQDLMHAGSAVPLISPEATMPQAVVEMSSKRLGMTIVADDTGQMLGIITDGDVRRGIEAWGKAFFDKKALEVMTKNPKTIAPADLAAHALAVMEKASITSLVVLSENMTISGIIHLHDILRQGIV